jgi:hypothetical protein
MDDLLSLFTAPGGAATQLVPGGFFPPYIAFQDDPLYQATIDSLIDAQVGQLASSPLAVELLGPDLLASLSNYTGGVTATGLPSTGALVNDFLNSPTPPSPDAILQTADALFLNGITNPTLQAVFGFDPSSPSSFGMQAIDTINGALA